MIEGECNFSSFCAVIPFCLRAVCGIAGGCVRFQTANSEFCVVCVECSGQYREISEKVDKSSIKFGTSMVVEPGIKEGPVPLEEVMTMELRTGVNRKFDNPTVEQALLRRELGEVLREYRQRQGRTLREVSSDARVSLGYLSEVERGQKEASSELLSSISRALNVPLSHILRVVADRIDVTEGRVPTRMMRSSRVQPSALKVPVMPQGVQSQDSTLLGHARV